MLFIQQGCCFARIGVRIKKMLLKHTSEMTELIPCFNNQLDLLIYGHFLRKQFNPKRCSLQNISSIKETTYT